MNNKSNAFSLKVIGAMSSAVIGVIWIIFSLVLGASPLFVGFGFLIIIFGVTLAIVLMKNSHVDQGDADYYEDGSYDYTGKEESYDHDYDDDHSFDQLKAHKKEVKLPDNKFTDLFKEHFDGLESGEVELTGQEAADFMKNNLGGILESFSGGNATEITRDVKVTRNGKEVSDQEAAKLRKKFDHMFEKFDDKFSEADSSEYGFCPYCGQKFKEKYSFCPKCGKALD